MVRIIFQIIFCALIIDEKAVHSEIHRIVTTLLFKTKFGSTSFKK